MHIHEQKNKLDYLLKCNFKMKSCILCGVVIVYTSVRMRKYTHHGLADPCSSRENPSENELSAFEMMAV